MRNPFNSLKDKITHYLQLRFEVLRLEVIERIGNLMGYFAFIILSFFLFFTTVFFTGFGLAAWFSAMFDSQTAGYFTTAGIMLIAAIVVVMMSKKIIRFFGNKTVWLLTIRKHSEEEDDEADKKEE